MGAIFGAYAVGATTGMVVLARVRRDLGMRWMPWLSIVSCAVLVPMVLGPGLAWSLALFALSGMASGYQLLANTTFVRVVPDEVRGQAFGLAVTALRVSQGLGIAAAGAVAEWWPVHTVVAAAGVMGAVAAGGAVWTWRQSTRLLEQAG